MIPADSRKFNISQEWAIFLLSWKRPKATVAESGSQPSKQKLVHPELPKNTEVENLWKFNLQSSSKLGSFIQYTFPFQEGILKNALCILGHEVAGASAEDEMWLGGVEMIGYFKLFQG